MAWNDDDVNQNVKKAEIQIIGPVTGKCSIAVVESFVYNPVETSWNTLVNVEKYIK